MFRTEAGLKGLPCLSGEIDERTDIRSDLRSGPALLSQPGSDLCCQRIIRNELFQIEHKLLAQKVVQKDIQRLVFLSPPRNNVEVVGTHTSGSQELQRADVSETNQFCRSRRQRGDCN